MSTFLPSQRPKLHPPLLLLSLFLSILLHLYPVPVKRRAELQKILLPVLLVAVEGVVLVIIKCFFNCNYNIDIRGRPPLSSQSGCGSVTSTSSSGGVATGSGKKASIDNDESIKQAQPAAPIRFSTSRDPVTVPGSHPLVSNTRLPSCSRHLPNQYSCSAVGSMGGIFQN